MKSKWFEYKDEIISLRRKGVSMTIIEREFGVPRSTLSGWFKDVELSEDQRTQLMKNRFDGWKKAREHAVISKNIAKTKRITIAKDQARDTLQRLPADSLAVMELALAMLYYGEGTKKNVTSLGNSDILLLRFFLSALEKLYGIQRNTLRYELHLRHDHDEELLKQYWATRLDIRPENINYIVKDKRTIGKPTINEYKGVCVVHVRDLSIQRRLIALYNVYCSEVIKGM